MKKFGTVMTALLAVAVLCTETVFAAEMPAVMNTYTEADSVVLFVKDIGEQIDHVYVDQQECSQYTVEEAGPVHTIVMVDNSLSIQEAFRSNIKTFLTDLVAARKDGDTFTIGTFAQDVNYLVQDGSDYLEIKQQIDSFEFVNQESYFLKSLYQLLEDLAAQEATRYTRIIVIADGVDNEELGYTDEELKSKIQEVQVPIYTIGCTGKSNGENLKKMFSLSRMSKAKNYLLPDEQLEDILQDILQDGIISRVTIHPDAALCDGTTKPIRLAAGEDYAQQIVKMPFQTASGVAPAASEAAEPSALPQETKAPQEIETPQEEQSPQKGLPLAVLLALGGAGVGLIVLLVILLVVRRRRKKAAEDKKPQVDISGIGHSSETAPVNPKSAGQVTGSLSGFGDGKTEVLVGAKTVRLCLQDQENPAKSFEYPLRDRVLIGKDTARCQIVIDYNRYVSGVHCEVFLKNGEYWVRDGGGTVEHSTNGTYVNDQKVDKELPLPEGSVLRLGEVRLKVSYQ